MTRSEYLRVEVCQLSQCDELLIYMYMYSMGILTFSCKVFLLHVGADIYIYIYIWQGYNQLCLVNNQLCQGFNQLRQASNQLWQATNQRWQGYNQFW